MSYISIPNQPLIFKPSNELGNDCKCDEPNSFKQLVHLDDELFFQLESTPCQDSIFGGSQTTGGWTNASGTVTSNSPNPAGFLSQPFYPKDINPVYAVTLVVTDITGTLVVGVSGSGTQTITVAGEQTLYFETNYIQSNPSFVLTITGATFVGSFYIESVFGIENGKLFLGLVDPESYEVITEIEPVITSRDQYLTAGFRVADLGASIGCYRLAIADYCENTCGQYYIFNPWFNPSRSGVQGWSSDPVTGTTEWTISNNLAEVTLGAGEVSSLKSVTQLCEGVEYAVEITVDSISNCRLRVMVNGVFQGDPITTSGVQTVTFTSTESGIFELIATQISGTPSTAEVSKITLTSSIETAQYNKYSDVISIGDYNSCDYFKINGCNAEDQFGLAFSGTSFLPGIRLMGRKFRAQYETDIELVRTASGLRSVPYADRQKKHSYYFGQLPEYVLDFLSVVFYFDNCYVNGQLISPADESFPDVEYNDASDLGSVTIELYSKQERITKTICSDADANCLPSILDLEDEPFILSQDGDRIVSQSNQNLYYEN